MQVEGHAFESGTNSFVDISKITRKGRTADNLDLLGTMEFITRISRDLEDYSRATAPDHNPYKKEQIEHDQTKHVQWPLGSRIIVVKPVKIHSLNCEELYKEHELKILNRVSSEIQEFYYDLQQLMLDRDTLEELQEERQRMILNRNSSKVQGIPPFMPRSEYAGKQLKASSHQTLISEFYYDLQQLMLDRDTLEELQEERQRMILNRNSSKVQGQSARKMDVVLYIVDKDFSVDEGIPFSTPSKSAGKELKNDFCRKLSDMECDLVNIASVYFFVTNGQEDVIWPVTLPRTISWKRKDFEEDRLEKLKNENNKRMMEIEEKILSILHHLDHKMKTEERKRPHSSI